MDLNRYLHRTIRCGCGREHTCSVRCIDIAEGALARLPGHIQALGCHHVFLVADRNTWAAAGKQAANALDAAGIPCVSYVIDADEPVPDEACIGALMMAFPMECDLVLAVGSGTINDLCKFVASRTGRESMILATAPSMDGFVSPGAALMLNHMKVTLDCRSPVAVVGDPDILCQAPVRLIAAGLGDTLGKYTCLLDWKLAHWITGEYYCPEVVRMVRTALETVESQSTAVQTREPAAVQAVMEALVLTGIAMSFTGNSRPASGCEHHLSHFWEMRTLMAGRMPALHGIQVGLGTILALRMYHELAEEKPDFELAMAVQPDPAAWERHMRACFLDAADAVIALEKKAGKNDPEARNRRLQAIRLHWNEICQAIQDELPPTEDMQALLLSLGGAVTPQQMGLECSLVQEGVEVARELRDRYTLLQLLWDLNLSEVYARRTADAFRVTDDRIRES